MSRWMDVKAATWRRGQTIACRWWVSAAPRGRPQKSTHIWPLVWGRKTNFKKVGPENGPKNCTAKNDATQCGFTFCVIVFGAVFRPSNFENFSGTTKKIKAEPKMARTGRPKHCQKMKTGNQFPPKEFRLYAPTLQYLD